MLIIGMLAHVWESKPSPTSLLQRARVEIALWGWEGREGKRSCVYIDFSALVDVDIF